MTEFDRFYATRYLPAHSQRATRACHYVGAALLAVNIAAAVLLRQPGFLLSGTMIAFSASWIGHGFFERNTPLFFTHPIWSVRAFGRMTWRALWGRR